MTARFPILYIAEADPEAAVLSSGVLAYLVEAMPRADFTVVGSPASAPLFADTARLDRLRLRTSNRAVGIVFTLSSSRLPARDSGASRTPTRRSTSARARDGSQAQRVHSGASERPRCASSDAPR